MANEATKEQIRQFLENAVRAAKNPNPREKMKRLRQEKVKKVSKMYGF